MKRFLILIISLLSAFTSIAQGQYGNFNQLRLFPVTKASDTAAIVANDGRIWYDFVTDEYRGIRNGVIFSFGSGSGGGTVTASNGLTKVGNDIQLGGEKTGNILIDGPFNFQVQTGGSSDIIMQSTGDATFQSNNTTDISGAELIIGGGLDGINVTSLEDINITTNNFISIASGTTQIGTADFGLAVEPVGSTTSLGGGDIGLIVDEDNDIITVSAAVTDPLSVVTKTYADTKLDGTMVSTRIPIGVDANTLTTDVDLTFTGGNTLNTAELTVSGLPASFGILFNNTVIDNEGAFTYNPTGNVVALLDGVSSVADTGTGSIVTIRENGDIRLDGNGDTDFTTLSENAITTASGDALTITADDITLNTDDIFITNAPDTGTGAVLLRDTGTGEVVRSNFTLEYTASSTYAPTLFNTTNVSASSALTCHYMQVGGFVTVSGEFQVTPTAGSAGTTTLTILGMSLPVGATFSTSNQAGGVGVSLDVSPANVTMNAQISADNANNRFLISFFASDTSSQSFSFTVSYTGAAIP